MSRSRRPPAKEPGVQAFNHLSDALVPSSKQAPPARHAGPAPEPKPKPTGGAVPGHLAAEPVIQLLRAYRPEDAAEADMVRSVLQLVIEHPQRFSMRDLPHGHLTASAWVVDETMTKVLLLHHGKLQRWLQPGGHLEPFDGTLQRAALREAREETGIEQFTLREGIFDVDVHEIPERPGQPRHVHFDVRFLLMASSGEPLRMSPESRELAWFDLDAVVSLNPDESIARMVRKTRKLRSGGRS